MAHITGIALALVIGTTSGCATIQSSTGAAGLAREGVVESVAQIAPRRVSALTGMLVGGVIANRECGTENRMVGLALGALGGAWAVNSSALDQRSQGYRVTVRLDSGAVEHVQSGDPVSIVVGQRVIVSGHQLLLLSPLPGDTLHTSASTL